MSVLNIVKTIALLMCKGSCIKQQSDFPLFNLFRRHAYFYVHVLDLLALMKIVFSVYSAKK